MLVLRSSGQETLGFVERIEGGMHVVQLGNRNSGRFKRVTRQMLRAPTDDKALHDQMRSVVLEA